MATLITKNSSTASSVPLAANLTQGELAVNVTDKKLYTKDSGGSVVQVGGDVTLAGTQTLTNKTLTSPTLTTPVLGTPASGTLTNATGLPLSTGVTGTLPVANGGTGTTTPSIVAGTNVTVTGTWPNQTIAASGGGGGSPGGSTTQVQYNNAGAFGGISGVTTDGTRMTASTTIGVGGATPSTSGSGVTFPATQSDSTNANTLDDYEEGTWTPTQGSNLTVVGAFSSNGVYTKIGRSIVVIGRVKGDTSVAVATANAVMAGGLPFTPLISIGYSTGIALTAVGANFSGMYLYSDSTLNTNVAITAQPQIYFSATYYI